jgi:hypothetical protein
LFPICSGVEPLDLDTLSRSELKALVEAQGAELLALKAVVAELRAEIARLKGTPPRPTLKPSGMDKATDGALTRPGGGRRRGPTKAKLVIDEERVLPAPAPAGSRFKGYEEFVVQDLVVRPHVVRFQRERHVLADGGTVIAPLPAGIDGHFGPGLKRFVVALYHQGQTTVARLTTVLRDIGVHISKRQVLRLLHDPGGALRAEAEAVRHAGVSSAQWLSVDDTGARHQSRNGFCTRVGDHRFTIFATRTSKSRRSFLEMLGGGAAGFTINEAALEHLRARRLPANQIARLAGHPRRHFADAQAWRSHLEALGLLELRQSPDPALTATEAALWGSAVERGVAADLTILSDDAGQFRVGHHALCWVHAERLVHKLPCLSLAQQRALERVRAGIWDLYGRLKAWRRDPRPEERAALEAAFDAVFRQKVPTHRELSRLLARLYGRKAELLAVLDQPAVPLHTNDAENDLRSYVTRREISFGTRSDTGRDSRDACLSLLKTATKLGIPFWKFLAARFGIDGAQEIPPLNELVLKAA